MGHQQTEYIGQQFDSNDLLSTAIKEQFLADESSALKPALSLLQRDSADNIEQSRQHIENLSRELIGAIRNPETPGNGAGIKFSPHIPFEDFLSEYNLATQEGIALMCLAEALLRIPDHKTAQALIEDKLSENRWNDHIGHSRSFWVNASTWGLLLTGKYFNGAQLGSPPAIFKNILQKVGAPLAEKAVRQAMALIGEQFIAGQDIESALNQSRQDKAQGFIHSYDMLGEAAICQQDVERYNNAYQQAIQALDNNKAYENPLDGLRQDSISIKLSALHPRYEFHQQQAVFDQLLPRLKQLIKLGQKNNVPITLDAEESFRLEISLLIFAELLKDPEINQWPYLGLAVQAYQKRAIPVIEWLTQLARKHNTVIPVRLVKGAYWDSEIKYAQQMGMRNYPVWTRRENTDANYLACSHLLFESEGRLYPQFATHNAHTVASVLHFAQSKPLVNYEFQRLYGMGETLYQHLSHLPQIISTNTPIRIYAPVGHRVELLAYLVRRLLENGANTSFVQQVKNEHYKVEDFLQDPVTKIKSNTSISNPKIPLPKDLFADERVNSFAWNLNGSLEFSNLINQMVLWYEHQWQAAPLSASNKALFRTPSTVTQTLQNPSDKNKIVGKVNLATEQDVRSALDQAHNAFPHWKLSKPQQRAEYLDQLANLMESNSAELLSLCVLESGKTYANAMNELREAVDLCRYYAVQCRKQFSKQQLLIGPSGEENTLMWQGRGVFLCISPWNFPLAIFIGQIAAALAAGNTVIAKPASNTPLIARRTLELFYQAGLPKEVLHFLPCSSAIIESALLSDPRIAGVAFTGSTHVAHKINFSLAQRKSALATIIAETGGQNAMIVDSSALPEQVVKDVALSAFDSAGQRCSALRVLYLQEDTADNLIQLLIGFMQQLKVGDPKDPATDIGPIIDGKAQREILQHIEYWQSKGHVLAQTPMDEKLLDQGYFVAPTLIRIDHIEELEEEIFGPVLHVISYKNNELDDVIDSINNTGFGLTLGIHSRINAKTKYISERVNVGNVYINRNMIGATVGVQPFGGMGLSGTGPKAGGPHYLQRFASEKACSTNIAAVGGDPFLLNAGNSEY